MSGHDDLSQRAYSHKFKTSTFTRLWKRYSDLDSTLRNNKSLIQNLSIPLLNSPFRDDFMKLLCQNRNNIQFSSGQRQTWSMFKSFRRLFSVPIVHCDSGNVSQENKDSISGADVIERNFNARRQHALANPTKIISEMEVMNYIAKQTGMDRLRGIFEKDMYGEESVEFQRISSQLSTMIYSIFFICMVLSGAKGREEFIRKNKATVFASKRMATRKLMDAIFLESIKGGLHWTIKFGFFSAVLITVSEGIAIYRNKTSPLEYTAAGGLAGSLVKFNLGPKGMISGGVIGTLIGFVLGLGITQLLRYTGETQEDRHFKKIQSMLLQDAAINQSLKTAGTADEDDRDYEMMD